LCILLLSTFRVSSINYSPVCRLPVHTRSPTNADGPWAHCQSKPCKTLHNCSTNGIWKGQQPMSELQGHSRSLSLLPFDRPYMISYPWTGSAVKGLRFWFGNWGSCMTMSRSQHFKVRHCERGEQKEVWLQ